MARKRTKQGQGEEGPQASGSPAGRKANPNWERERTGKRHHRGLEEKLRKYEVRAGEGYEFIPALMHTLARYAANVPEKSQTDLERRMTRALDEIPEARRMIERAVGDSQRDPLRAQEAGVLPEVPRSSARSLYRRCRSCADHRSRRTVSEQACRNARSGAGWSSPERAETTGSCCPPYASAQGSSNTTDSPPKSIRAHVYEALLRERERSRVVG